MTIDEALKRYEPRLRDAFLAGVNEITSRAQIGVIERALERGDIPAAIEALYLDRGAFLAFEQTLVEGYGTAGAASIEDLGTLKDQDGAKFHFFFNLRNARAEQWLRDNAAGLVTRVVDEQRQMIRQRLEAGMQAGDNPRAVALEVAGRINRETGKREGGIVGLSRPFEEAVANAKDELRSGDYSAYRQRVARDKRFDTVIAKAEREGRTLTADEIAKITNRYSDRLLLLRATTLARTEALTSTSAAQYEALRQLVETNKVRASQIKRVWDATFDKRTRFDHAVAEGQTVGLEQDFLIGGKLMRHPHDPRGGPGNVINCRCRAVTKIDFLAAVE
jgi:hypothetical protein